MTEVEKSKKPSKWADRPISSRTLAIVAGVVSVTLCLCCGLLVLSLGASEVLAKAMVPPLYPNATGGCARSGGPDSMWEGCTYRTTDDIDNVLHHYEARMPGFRQSEDSSSDNIYYSNGRLDNSLLGILASWTVDDHIRPSVSISISISISEGAGADAETVINIHVEWPAQ